ncbi:hypothetical protein I4U23_004714 [Adineta vaga]|nr:hypothetical protein I4U23_004714 [Adineta vaga]
MRLRTIFEGVSNYPTSCHIETKTREELLKSPYILKNLYDITAQSYLNPTDRTMNSIQESTHIYLARIKDRYIGYMMIDFDFGLSISNGQPIVHAVLGCTDHQWKEHGIHHFLHGYFISRVQEYQEKKSMKVLVWLSTVTPFITRLVPEFYTNIQPNPDGHASDDLQYLPVLRQIQSKMKWKLDDDERNKNPNKHTFIQYGISKNLLYTDKELQRIKQFQSQSKDQYNTFQLDMEKGDRIVYILTVTDKKIEFIPNTQNST